MASGGYRPTAPQNNTGVSATGGAGSKDGQPNRYISGGKYGEGQATMAQQQGAPMYEAATATAAPMGAIAGAMSSVVPLTAPTQRPNEPLTAGMPFGEGPGVEALSLPQQRSLSQILASMIDLDPTGDAKDLYDFVISRGL